MARRKPNNVDVLVGKRIKDERLKQDMSRAVLAERLGICGEQLRKNENAKNRIAIGSLVDIENALGVKLCSLLYGNGVELITLPVDEYRRVMAENKRLRRLLN